MKKMSCYHHNGLWWAVSNFRCKKINIYVSLIWNHTNLMYAGSDSSSVHLITDSLTGTATLFIPPAAIAAPISKILYV